MQGPVCIFWFRRDLRLDDNAGLYHALKSGYPVLPVFIFDKEILDKLEDKADARVTFIRREIQSLKQQLQQTGSDLYVAYGTPADIWQKLLQQYEVKHVFTNHDYEPAAIERDEKIRKMLAAKDIGFSTYKDQCIFEKHEVVKDNGEPYTVFTPYSKKWKMKLSEFYVKPYPCAKYADAFLKTKTVQPLLPLEQMGFKSADQQAFPSREVASGLIRQYDQTRDYPGIEGTSKLGIHFRFGTISIRDKASKARKLNETFLNELIWRDFYMMILFHFPHVVAHPFRREYEQIAWRNDEEEFEKWCRGETGYPIVDAGMRELNETGYMHNRVRMIVASFLTKHLLIDWRWGEAYFAQKLLDYDLSANNGGWQWAAGCGTDAAPYFRVFNPSLQAQKFDPQMLYIHRWVPELKNGNYVKPVVDHAFARARCLEAYKKALAR